MRVSVRVEYFFFLHGQLKILFLPKTKSNVAQLISRVYYHLTFEMMYIILQKVEVQVSIAPRNSLTCYHAGYQQCSKMKNKNKNEMPAHIEEVTKLIFLCSQFLLYRQKKHSPSRARSNRDSNLTFFFFTGFCCVCSQLGFQTSVGTSSKIIISKQYLQVAEIVKKNNEATFTVEKSLILSDKYSSQALY